MPIHVRAEPGDYADACLLPGDPLRAKYIAETFFDDPVQGNGERGMLGYTGTFERQAGLGAVDRAWAARRPAIVIEELIQLGVKRILRVGTCGGLQPDLADRRPDRRDLGRAGRPTATHYVGGEPHAPTADWELIHGAVHEAKELGKKVRVGPIVSSDVFYNPDPGSTSAGRTAACSPSRWRRRCSSRSARCERSRPAAC